jgi:hypothetical protein
MLSAKLSHATAGGTSWLEDGAMERSISPLLLQQIMSAVAWSFLFGIVDNLEGIPRGIRGQLIAAGDRPHDARGRVERLRMSVESIISDSEDRHAVEERRNAVEATCVVVIPDLQIPSPGLKHQQRARTGGRRSSPLLLPIFVEVEQDVDSTVQSIPRVELRHT